jgi:hypothetical protein
MVPTSLASISLPLCQIAKSTWQHVEADLNNAAASGDTTQASIALQMVLQLERTLNIIKTDWELVNGARH